MIRSVVELSFRPPRLLGWAPSVPSAALGGLRASEVSLISLTPPVISMPPVSLAVLAPPTLAIPVTSMPLMLLTILVPPVLPRPLVTVGASGALGVGPRFTDPSLEAADHDWSTWVSLGQACQSPSISCPRPILNSGKVQSVMRLTHLGSGAPHSSEAWPYSSETQPYPSET